MAGVKGRSGGWNRKSAEAHAIAGTYRRDRHERGNLAVLPTARETTHRDPNEQETRRLLRGLSRPSRSVGRTLLAEYENWTPADLAVLRLLLEALDRAAECRRLIDAEGLTVKGKRGVARPHPLIRAERQAAAFAAGMFKQLGLGGMK